MALPKLKKYFQKSESFIVERAKGSKIYDIDGNEYTDYCLNGGANILGHANRTVVLSAKKHAERGICFGSLTKAEIDISHYIIEKVPSIDQLCFVNSGTEATLSAIRLAQCVTGRRHIVSFEGMYHGFHGLVPMAPNPANDDGYVLSFNNVEVLEKVIDKNHTEIAAIILEPVAVHMGIILPDPKFLTALKTLTKNYGIVLIFDEVMTGFRGFSGCEQSRLDIVPDLTCLGTVIGGGFPIGAYGGRSDMMRRLAPEGDLYQMGTFSASPVVLRAGMMTLRLMNDSFYHALNQKAERFVSEMNGFFDEKNINAHIVQFYSMMSLVFSKKGCCNYQDVRASEDVPLYKELVQHLFLNGIYFPSIGTEPFFFSGKHSKKDLKILSDVMKDFFE